jgi:hypothetical protein
LSSSSNFPATLLFPLHGCPQITTKAINELVLSYSHCKLGLDLVNNCGWTELQLEEVRKGPYTVSAVNW